MTACPVVGRTAGESSPDGGMRTLLALSLFGFGAAVLAGAALLAHASAVCDDVEPRLDAMRAQNDAVLAHPVLDEIARLDTRPVTEHMRTLIAAAGL